MPLSGDLVSLREVREDDLPMFVRLRNELATQAWSRTLPTDYTAEMMRRRYLDRDFQYRRVDAIFVIEVHETGEAVGTISYTGLIDRMEARWGIAVDRSVWGSGAAADAGETLLRFLFLELGLKVVRLGTQTENERAVAAFSKLGFRPAVRVPLSVYKAGRHVENLFMDMLREEWFALHPRDHDEMVDPHV